MNKFINKTQLFLSVPVLSCCFARTGVTTTQNSKTRTPKNSYPSVGTTKTQGQFTRQKRRNGSGRNKHRFQQNLPVYMRKFCKGTDKRMTRSSENRGTDKDRSHVVFFVTGTNRASDLKLLRLVRIRFRPYIKRQWKNPPYYFCVSSKEKNTNFECNNNVSDNSGKCF